MPTYEYECIGCKKHFEFFQGINEPPKDLCPECSKPLKRLMGKGAGIIFKGSGFYATDYRKKESKKNSPSEKSPCCSVENKEKKD